jgi:L-asparaginase II
MAADVVDMALAQFRPGGAGRAAQAVMAALIARFLPLIDAERAALERFVHPTLRNWNGFETGALRVTAAI